MKRPILAAVVAAMLFAGGCAEPAKLDAGSKGEADRRLQGVWRLESVSGVPATPDPGRPHRFDVSFQGGQVSGSVACNRFAGPYRTGGGRLETAISQTLVGCAQPDDPTDHLTMRAMQAGVFEVDGEVLRLREVGGATFVFRRPRS